MTTKNWAEPYKIKMVELIKMTSREDRLRRHSRGRLQHFSAPFRRRLYRPVDRFRGWRDERPPMVGNHAG